MEIITTDLSRFGSRELDMAIDLLKAYRYQLPEFLGRHLALHFDIHSGQVYLQDEDYNTGMLDNDQLKQYVVCEDCNKEGFLDDLDENGNKVFADDETCMYCHSHSK